MRIVVDPIACEAHGLCAELLPEAISLDDWGYPVIARDELPECLEPLARRAVSACPTQVPVEFQHPHVGDTIGLGPC